MSALIPEAKKNRLFDGLALFEVLDDDSLQKRRGDSVVPDALGIYNDNWSVRAYSQARRFAPLHAVRAEQQIFPLQQLGELRIELTSPALG